LSSVAAAGLLAGCVERRVVYVHDQAPPPPVPPQAEVAPPPQAEVAPEAPPPGEVPPPPQTEVITVSPGPAYVWWEARGCGMEAVGFGARAVGR